MQKARRLTPTWLMGLTNAPFGLTGGFCAVIVPQLLATHGIRAGHVAAITAAILSPGFWIFAGSPMLDAWLSRRTMVEATTGMGFLAVSSRTPVSALLHASFSPGSLRAGRSRQTRLRNRSHPWLRPPTNNPDLQFAPPQCFNHMY